MIEIRWHGRGGQGSFTASRILGAAASVYGGINAMAFPSFGPERRGAPVLGFTKLSREPITDRSEILNPDYVIVLDESLWEEGVTLGLKEDTVIILNTQNARPYREKVSQRVVGADVTAVALEVTGLPMANLGMMGAFAAVEDTVALEAIHKAVLDAMKPSVAQKNIEVIQRVYHAVKEAL
ncbi:MAG: pyruvate ferredoxin oxidoreductase [delta proteobacterium ML8_F1]|nr:MAG: pyruvate ferredoxin oxidoreductase [delta proteobacterium ML8_F1]